jgi:thiol-disulfide isomerase/thioredoxin
MKKISPLLWPFIIFILGCSDAPIIEPESTGRIVLAEFFTFARCSYCPFVEHALDSLAREYGDSLAVIAYHRRQADDTLSPAYISVRESFYGVTSSPATVFDGSSGIVQVEDPAQNYAVFSNWITNERNMPPKMKLLLEINTIASSVNARLHIMVIDSLVESEYRLFFILYEDSVFFVQTGAPDSIFYFVARKMIPDEQGILIDPAYPDSLVREVDFNLSPDWDQDRLGLVAFVQDMATKQILQAVVDKRIKGD